MNRILVINLAFIGDVLLSAPVVTALHDAFPQAEIDFMVTPLTEPVAARHPFIYETLVYDKRGKHKKWRELIQLIRQVRSKKYDLALCTNFASRGAMLSWAAGIPQRVGYDVQQAGFFLTHKVSADRAVKQHETENYLAVLKPLQIKAVDKQLKVVVRPEDRQGLVQKYPGLGKEKPLVALCPVGSYGRKSWTREGYVQTITALADKSQLVLLGGQKEAGELEAINQEAGNQALVLAGTLSLGELAALLAVCQLLITVDTGPLHLAQAVGTPVVALFGPTDPAIWGPRGERDRVFYDKQACSPCWGKGDCRENVCLSSIAATDVIAAAEEQIRNGATV